MPRAINWAKDFFDTIKNQAKNTENFALRAGSLYFDNQYYKQGDVVDIRVNHKLVRQAQITQPLALYKLNELPTSIMSDGTILKSMEDIKHFFKKYYNIEIADEDEVTLIRYRNLELYPQEILDDPHG